MNTAGLIDVPSRYPKSVDFKFTKGSEDDLTKYIFANKTRHFFCPVCGTGLIVNRLEGDDCYAANLRCLEGVDLNSLDYYDYDGASV